MLFRGMLFRGIAVCYFAVCYFAVCYDYYYIIIIIVTLARYGTWANDFCACSAITTDTQNQNFRRS
jgi:hypothetical protein